MLMNILPRHFLCFPDYTERDWTQACDFPGQHTRSLRGYQQSLYQQAAEKVDSRIGRSVILCMRLVLFAEETDARQG